MAAALRGAYARLLELYCAQLQRSPWTTQAATSALLWCAPAAAVCAQRTPRHRRAAHARARAHPRRRGAGDVAAQSIERTGDAGGGGGAAPAAAPGGTDARRVALVTAYGGLFVGPLGHAWYELLDRVTRRYWPAGSVRCIAAKIAADTVVFGPVHVASFFGLMGLAAGESRAAVETRLRDKFWPTLLAESVAWPAVQALNFWRVPVQHQLLVVNVVSLADCTFLSWVKHQQDIGAWRERLRGGPFGP